MYEHPQTHTQPLHRCSKEDVSPLKSRFRGGRNCEVRGRRWQGWDRAPKPLRSCGVGVTPDCDLPLPGKARAQQSDEPYHLLCSQSDAVALLLSELQWSPTVPHLHSNRG